MDENDFPGLIRVLDYYSKTRKFYWLAGILFWLGAFLSFGYYIVPTGTVPSIVPGILMLAGVIIYFGVRYFNKFDLDA